MLFKHLQGKSQWIRIAFPEEKLVVSPLVLKIQFQGGFSSKLCTVKLLSSINDEISTADCYPEDINSIQSFELNYKCENQSYSAIKIEFKNSTDFFGRITIYRLDILNALKQS